QCGWDIGRLGAQGLYNYCTRTSSPRPGDLVFFKNTYAAPDPNGVTHCGLYVGDGWMFHSRVKSPLTNVLLGTNKM
ncbi:MAG: C40 family peptidase, partial [Oscillospiraceae bacterium]|nr:C40 family peptidase [Oscillospiraceae bacterium]